MAFIQRKERYFFLPLSTSPMERYSEPLIYKFINLGRLIVLTCVCVWCVRVCMLSHSVMCDSFATLWTVAYQAPLSWDFPGKNTGVGCHALLQGIFPTQGLNPHLSVPCIGRWILYHCSTWESPQTTLIPQKC